MFVVPLMVVFPQHGLTLIVVVMCRRMEIMLMNGVQSITVRMVHDFLLFYTKVIFRRRFWLAF
jgi:hypothetical protein